MWKSTKVYEVVKRTRENENASKGGSEQNGNVNDRPNGLCGRMLVKTGWGDAETTMSRMPSTGAGKRECGLLLFELWETFMQTTLCKMPFTPPSKV